MPKHKLVLAAALCGAAVLTTQPAFAAKRATASQSKAIARAVQATAVDGLGRIPAKQYTVSGAKVSTVSSAWAYAQLKPAKAFRNTFQTASVVLVQPAGTTSWVVVDAGAVGVGCNIAPDAVLADLFGGKLDCTPA